MRQYGREDLELLFRTADVMADRLQRAFLRRPLDGRIMMTAFFEPSTRTRLVHETAMLRLGGTVSGFADPSVTRAEGSTAESDEDILRMLDSYADVIVLRHPTTGRPAELAARLTGALLINGGDGTGEHPTQAMVDLYTLYRRFGSIDGLRLLLVNDLRMRCVNSLLLGLRNFDCEVSAVATDGMDRPEGEEADWASDGPPVTIGGSVVELLPKVDVLYSSPTVSLRSAAGDRTRPLTIDRRLLEEHAGRHLAVLHPLPRKGELATDVDDTPFNAYWAQATYGVAVRMALLTLMFDA
ncbi:aspartate carbamoyltransferase [Kitasatospora viridis]|uniref:Aspartate carbamoyltransferase n=2 Tax=Kitasatospora viridis TaxID=281105 RepID=A0A561T7B4_9ACTN|nr:aspartate carbamoyltransferase [Kitasatospora viridis]